VKIDCVVCWEYSGTVTVKSESCEIRIQLNESQRNRILAVARDAFLEHQMNIATEVASVPPSFQLEAPPEYTPFEAVNDDSVPF
jgi:hypothetical protein